VPWLISDLRNPFEFCTTPFLLPGADLSISVAFTIEVNVSTAPNGTEIPDSPSDDRMQAIACIEAPKTGGRMVFGCVTYKI
jgi:hypothetical protein